jgi:hypothetical protein
MLPLLRAAPALRELHTEVLRHVPLATMCSMLRNEPPYGPLRIHALVMIFGTAGTQTEVLEFCAAARTHASLRKLELVDAPLGTAAAAAAVADTMRTLQVTSLDLTACHLRADSMQSLASMVGTSLTLKSLSIQWGNAESTDAMLLDERAAALLSAGLRDNRSLTEVMFENLDPGGGDGTALAVVLDALVGHPCLRTLTACCGVPDEGRGIVGAALAALVAADTPALQELDIEGCGFGDDGLAALFDALPLNTHLCTLRCGGIYLSEAFAAARVLPAVQQANTSLRKFCAVPCWPGTGDLHPGLAAAMALVEARAAADA